VGRERGVHLDRARVVGAPLAVLDGGAVLRLGLREVPGAVFAFNVDAARDRTPGCGIGHLAAEPGRGGRRRGREHEWGDDGEYEDGRGHVGEPEAAGGQTAHAEELAPTRRAGSWLGDHGCPSRGFGCSNSTRYPCRVPSCRISGRGTVDITVPGSPAGEAARPPPHLPPCPAALWLPTPEFRCSWRNQLHNRLGPQATR